MKTTVELDEVEIKQAIEAHLDEQGFIVRQILLFPDGAGTENDSLKFYAKADVEKKAE